MTLLGAVAFFFSSIIYPLFLHDRRTFCSNIILNLRVNKFFLEFPNWSHRGIIITERREMALYMTIPISTTLVSQNIKRSNPEHCWMCPLRNGKKKQQNRKFKIYNWKLYNYLSLNKNEVFCTYFDESHLIYNYCGIIWFLRQLEILTFHYTIIEKPYNKIILLVCCIAKLLI